MREAILLELCRPSDALEQQYMAAWTVPFLRPTINSAKDYGHFTAIGILQEGAPVAVVVYNGYVGHDIHMTIASKSKRWANRDILRGLFAYPFLELGCARVTACTQKANRSARKLLEQAGFELEGKQRKGHLGMHDLLYYGMLKNECKWL